MKTALHPLVRAAAAGALPAWANASPKRRKHMARVAQLMRDWASTLGASPEDVDRWVAVGYLHDALRDEDPKKLRARVSAAFRDMPGRVLHGPAAAERLREEGVDDEPLLRAVAYHTLGHPSLDLLGRALYVADFLEPGRSFRRDWRARQRERMPDELEEVTREVVAVRIRHLIDRKRPLRTETVEFWNTMTTGEPWVAASEV